MGATLLVDDSESSVRVLGVFKGLEGKVDIREIEASQCADFKPPALSSEYGFTDKEEKIITYAKDLRRAKNQEA